MPAVYHLSRRGAVYYWRRRLPSGHAALPLGVIAISTGTKDQDDARRIGALLTLMSQDLFEQIKRGHLTPDETKAILVAVARQHAVRLAQCAVDARGASDGALIKVLERISGEKNTLPVGENTDRIVGAMYRLLSERGRDAELTDQDGPFLESCGLSLTDSGSVAQCLNMVRNGGGVPPPVEQLRRLLQDYAPEVEPTRRTLIQTETAFYRGMAAARLHTAPRWGSTVADDIALLTATPVLPPADSIRGGQNEPALQVDPAATVTTPQTQVLPANSVIDVPTTINGLAEKLAILRTTNEEWTEKTAHQVLQSAKLLAKVVGHDDFCRLTQIEFASFRDVLLELPKGYGKSSRDEAKSIPQLLAEGRKLPKEKRGVVATTINRHLTSLSDLIKYAASYGLRPGEKIDLSELRGKKKGRDRDDRAPMSLADMKSIFALPPWSGCRSESERLEKGDCVVHDAMYWVPLIAAYSLARREEICGLMIADVKFDAEIPYFDLKRNKYRRLKNPQSKRKIPIHLELLRLGLREYVGAISRLGYDVIFPDLLSARGTGPLGDQFQDVWEPVLATAVPNAEAERKVFHSIRHFGNNSLVDAKIMLEWRQDIMGHGGRNESEERYRDETRLKRKLSALKKIPDLTGDLRTSDIMLKATVANKISRRPRSSKSNAKSNVPT